MAAAPVIPALHDSTPPSGADDMSDDSRDHRVRIALVEREVRHVRTTLEDTIERVEAGMRDGFAAIDRRLADGAAKIDALALAQAKADAALAGTEKGVGLGWKVATAVLGLVATALAIAAARAGH